MLVGTALCPFSARADFEVKWSCGEILTAAAFGTTSGYPTWTSESIADLDGTGGVELVVRSAGGGSISILDGATGASRFVFTIAGTLYLTTFADVDRDGLLDLIVVMSSGTRVVGWVGDPGTVMDDPQWDGPGHGVRGAGNSRPNPFGGQTEIAFSVQTPARVDLNVYEVTGRLVRRLAAGRFGAGDHSVVWNGRDDDGHPLPSGTYFYTLRVDGDEVLSRKVIALH
jgi:hypothetical protein